MQIKVCGMSRPGNIDEVASLDIDMMGFIFYRKSPRCVGELSPATISRLRREGVEPVALFVDEDIDTAAAIMKRYGFSTVQLHGSESPRYCSLLRARGFRVLKAVGIADSGDIAAAATYDGHADMLVLDTRTSGKAGSGRKFDWSLLEKVTFATPFLLSGGIGPDDAADVKTLYGRMNGRMAGIDVNSRFETAPGEKSRELLDTFIHNI